MVKDTFLDAQGVILRSSAWSGQSIYEVTSEGTKALPRRG